MADFFSLKFLEMNNCTKTHVFILVVVFKLSGEDFEIKISSHSTITCNSGLKKEEGVKERSHAKKRKMINKKRKVKKEERSNMKIAISVELPISYSKMFNVSETF